MKIEYTIRGITLSAGELADIDRYYEAACTAQYMLESYDQVRTEKQALELGYEVRRRMSKYDFSEQEAIDNVLSELDEVPDEVEVMLTDLTPEAQEEVMRVLGISSPAEGNYDVTPLFTIYKPEDAETEGDHAVPSSTGGDYGPANPWDAPGMSVSDLI